MARRQILRVAIATVGGVVGGLVIAAVALIVATISVLVLLHVFGESETERAKKDIRGVIGHGIKIDGCHRVTDLVDSTFRCRVRTSDCSRSFLFSEISDSGGLTHVELRHAPAKALSTPCAVPNDPG